MRLAYLDCFAGLAGDMFLGALIDAGVPLQVLEDATRALDIGAGLSIETVDRSGISCTKVHVLEHDEPAEAKPRTHTHTHATAPSHGDDSVLQQETSHARHTHQPRTQHLHKAGHAHTHEPAPAHDESEPAHAHPHVHGRSLTQIRSLIEAAALAGPVKQRAIRSFELLGASEAKIHNVPVDQIHFHEVGAVDAIVDIVASCAGIHHLGIGAWHCSPVNVGGGMVECAHGTFPVPAPATADLLRGFPTYSAHVQKELVTPTGAALLRMLAPTFGPQPPMQVEQIGYGAGTRNPKDFPNVLRISVGTASAPVSGIETAAPGAEEAPAFGHPRSEAVTVLETALDDLSPQVLAYVAEKAFAEGALDVVLTPVIMKKGRPGTLLTVLCHPAESPALEHLLLRETSTLGVRIRQDRRVSLDRRHATVETRFGSIRMKIGSDAGEERNVAPEFEDCRAAAAEHGVPLKQVQQAAIAAYGR